VDFSNKSAKTSGISLKIYKTPHTYINAFCANNAKVMSVYMFNVKPPFGFRRNLVCWGTQKQI